MQWPRDEGLRSLFCRQAWSRPERRWAKLSALHLSQTSELSLPGRLRKHRHMHCKTIRSCISKSKHTLAMTTSQPSTVRNRSRTACSIVSILVAVAFTLVLDSSDLGFHKSRGRGGRKTKQLGSFVAEERRNLQSLIKVATDLDLSTTRPK